MVGGELNRARQIEECFNPPPLLAALIHLQSASPRRINIDGSESELQMKWAGRDRNEKHSSALHKWKYLEPHTQRMYLCTVHSHAHVTPTHYINYEKSINTL